MSDNAKEAAEEKGITASQGSDICNHMRKLELMADQRSECVTILSLASWKARGVNASWQESETHSKQSCSVLSGYLYTDFSAGAYVLWFAVIAC